MTALGSVKWETYFRLLGEGFDLGRRGLGVVMGKLGSEPRSGPNPDRTGPYFKFGVRVFDPNRTTGSIQGSGCLSFTLNEFGILSLTSMSSTQTTTMGGFSHAPTDT